MGRGERLLPCLPEGAAARDLNKLVGSSDCDRVRRQSDPERRQSPRNEGSADETGGLPEARALTRTIS